MILVTGATGLLGSYLARALLARGLKVRALRRKHSDLSLLGDYAEKIEWVEGDITDVVSLEEAMKDVKQVFHCAALVSFKKKDAYNLYKVNVEGTANVANSALANGVEKFIHVSSTAAFGFHPPQKIIDETTVYSETLGMINYFRSKHFAEREVWRAAAEGLPTIIANVSTILGGGWWDSEPNNIFLLVKKKFPFYTSGVNGFIDVRDAAMALITLMEKAQPGTQYIVSAHNVSLKTIIQKIAEILRVRHPFIEIKSWHTSMASPIMSIYERWFNHGALLTSEKLNIATQRLQYNNALFRSTFNYNFLPLEKTLQDCCAALEESMRNGTRFGLLEISE
ncbi:MAG: SDR family NAD(P)-dependent oxidoreductase [Chitinophagales bacterium]|nr:SDR family NAD(P)-dependent oxidoreductase [Chitinophagales bacterium]MDW8272813.1 SDR family NAD(P)-dependent oxidoreductase [Chitinophagales bacterium]